MRTLMDNEGEDLKTLMYPMGSSESQRLKRNLFIPLVVLYEKNGFALIEGDHELDTEPGPRLFFYQFKIITHHFD